MGTRNSVALPHEWQGTLSWAFSVFISRKVELEVEPGLKSSTLIWDVNGQRDIFLFIYLLNLFVYER